jgi:hypothetical protein
VKSEESTYPFSRHLKNVSVKDGRVIVKNDNPSCLTRDLIVFRSYEYPVVEHLAPRSRNRNWSRIKYFEASFMAFHSPANGSKDVQL